MIDLGTPRPLQDAVDSLSAKTPIGSALRSPDWENVPVQLRESAFFSAAVESARFLEVAQQKILKLVSLQRGADGAFLSRERFIVELRKLANDLGLDTTREAADQGTVRDITSDSRLGLIFDIQTQRAAEFAKWKTEQDPDVLDAYPAQRLLRIEDRQAPRKWVQRWTDAGGQVFEGRMIALKSSPIWSKISRFGTPWPPFDFNSGMGLEDIGRDEAVRLGLLRPGQPVQPQAAKFTDAMQASVTGLSPLMQTALTTIFGGQVDVYEGNARWVGGIKG